MLIKRCFITFATLIFLALPLFAEEGQKHEGHHDHGSSTKSEPKHDMSSHGEHQHGSKTDAKTDYDYVRVDTPAGFNTVIGRKNPLPEHKPIVSKDKDGNTVKEYALTVEDVKFEIFPGKVIKGWGFNGSIPGPTIRVTEGDIVKITLKNKTDTDHTIHVHGQKKRVVMDGVPYIGQKPVKKGESYTYEFIAGYPGTHWYHCHVDSAHHVDMGMYGAFIVEPKKEPIEYDREYIMILDEWPTAHVHIHKEGMKMEGHEEHGVVTEHPGVPRHEHEKEKPQKRDWYPETYAPYQPVYDGFSINGRSFPFTEPLEVKKGEKVLIRIINAGYKSHFIHSHSHKFRVVARSGSPVSEPQKIDTVEIEPSNRVDIILYADNPGIWPFHCHRLDHLANEHIYPGGMLTFIKYID
jgi:FtsP/CotA-like multicopper oxidase with cupredoxin domain